MKDKNEKQIMLRGGHYQEGEAKRRKKVDMGDVLSIQKLNIFKPVEITIKRGLR
jgi:hypothetical protein